MLLGTRVLQANGTYKKASELSTSDKLINIDGRAVKIKRVYTTYNTRLKDIYSESWYQKTTLASTQSFFQEGNYLLLPKQILWQDVDFSERDYKTGYIYGVIARLGHTKNAQTVFYIPKQNGLFTKKCNNALTHIYHIGMIEITEMQHLWKYSLPVIADIHKSCKREYILGLRDGFNDACRNGESLNFKKGHDTIAWININLHSNPRFYVELSGERDCVMHIEVETGSFVAENIVLKC